MERSERTPPNTISYNAALSALARCGQWQRALALLERMAAGGAGAPPNTTTYNSALTALARGAQPDRVLDLLARMGGRAPADCFSYCTAITAMAKDGRSGEALRLLEEMEGLGVKGDPSAYNAVRARVGAGTAAGTPGRVPVLGARALPLHLHAHARRVTLPPRCTTARRRHPDLCRVARRRASARRRSRLSNARATGGARSSCSMAWRRAASDRTWARTRR
eukprot:383635-Prymnesium_polylepis.1